MIFFFALLVCLALTFAAAADCSTIAQGRQWQLSAEPPLFCQVYNAGRGVWESADWQGMEVRQ